MKLYSALFLFAGPALVAAECDNTPEEICISEGTDCKDSDKECCKNGYGCFGMPWYKKCQELPECLPQWYDCSNGIECCGEDHSCIVDQHGNKVCDKETITTRTVELTDVPTASPTLPKTVDATHRPTNSPTKAPTGQVTKDPENTEMKNACSTGDPHITTFDGLKYDCQGHGEHILLKSTVTDRQVQGRYEQIKVNQWSATTGVVVQDEGLTKMPIVQLSIPITAEGVRHKVGDPSKGCEIQMFVDGVQKDIYEGTGTDDVTMTVSADNKRMTILYPETGFKISVTMGYWNGCMLHTCVTLPASDTTVVGILGNADGDPSNDWMALDGTVTEIPEIQNNDNLRGWPGYEFCTTNFCLTDEADSLFTYNEVGVDFEDFSFCHRPAATWTTEFVLGELTADIDMLCNGDFACVVDATVTDFETARMAKVARDGFKKASCHLAGGECDVNACCEGFKCQNQGGLATSTCVAEDTPEPTCFGDLAECGPGKACCDSLICMERANGKAYCQSPPAEFLAPGEICEQTETTCAAGTLCLGPAGAKVCTDVHIVDGKQLLKEGDACGYEGAFDCEAGSSCIVDAYTTGSKHCVAMPQCWAKMWRPCGENGYPDCCEDSGLYCGAHNGRFLCKPKPTCAAQWNECSADVPCCSGGDGPSLACMEHPADPEKNICYPDAPLFDFDVLMSKNLNGGDLAGESVKFEGVTMGDATEKCAQKCKDTTGCLSFTTKAVTGGWMCYPKDANTVEEAATGSVVSGTRACVNSSWSNTDLGCTDTNKYCIRKYDYEAHYNKAGLKCAFCSNNKKDTDDNNKDRGCTDSKPHCVKEDGKSPWRWKAGVKCVSVPAN